MVDPVLPELTPGVEMRISPTRFILRTLWVAIRLILVFYLGQQGVLFFYQIF